MVFIVLSVGFEQVEDVAEALFQPFMLVLVLKIEDLVHWLLQVVESEEVALLHLLEQVLNYALGELFVFEADVGVHF